MKTKTLSLTEMDVVNSVHLTIVDIYFVSEPWIVLRMRMTYDIIEIIRIGKPPWFDNNIYDLNR